MIILIITSCPTSTLIIIIRPHSAIEIHNFWAAGPILMIYTSKSIVSISALQWLQKNCIHNFEK